VGFAIVRYEPGGTLDPTFSANGKATARFRVGGAHFGNSVSLQTDGKIVVGGAAGVEFGPGGASTGAFAIVRYRSNGCRDASFGGDGKV
jgi:hypothetical protein